MSSEKNSSWLNNPSRRTFSLAAVSTVALVVTASNSALANTRPFDAEVEDSRASTEVEGEDLNDPNSYALLVNKRRPLNPLNFAPSDLVVPNVPNIASNPEIRQVRKEAATAAELMFAEAKLQGHDLVIVSAYRSFQLQTQVFNYYVERDGQKLAETYSARPGYSEHQTGLTMDIAAAGDTDVLEESFADEPAGVWAAANSHRFGFILRYPRDKDTITGYVFEPWHFRYIGVERATSMRASGFSTYEEFVGAEPAPGYVDPAN